MPHQPNLFSTNTPHGSAEPVPPSNPQVLGASRRNVPVDPQPQQGRNPAWLHRTDLFLRVIVRLYLGLLLVALPWTHLWDDNRIFALVPQIAWLAANGVVRGVVSGLGLLNVWIAVSDALHYREP